MAPAQASLLAKLDTQERVRDFLTNAVASGRASHAYLFLGAPGAGKLDAAWALAQAFLCEQDGCGSCDSCVRVARHTHPDVHYYTPESATGYLIAQTRELLDDVPLAPIRAKAKVYIIDRAEQLRANTANALLKTLEEPPEGVMFILLGTSADVMLPTIVSRCQCVPFRLVSPAVAAQAAAAAFWNMGENCTANSRIIVPRKRKDAFTEALLAELENWRIGDPLDPENNLGSIVSEGQFRTIMGYIEKGKAEGGHVLTGGAPLAIGSGLFIPPTIFDGVTPDMTIVREEIFGPVTAILPADSDEEAVGLANATAYGLQATLFTEDVTKAHKYARALKAGTVSVNCFSEGDNTTPFGGYKLSGFGGKDKGRESHDQYTETKTIFLNLDR